MRIACLALLAACSFDALPKLGDGGGSGDGTGDGSSVPPYASCTGLDISCGPSSNDNCCSPALELPAGEVYLDYDEATDLFNDMSHHATLSSPFVLDKYEVTVGRFRKFVQAGLGTRNAAPPAGAGSRTLNGMAGQGGWESSWNPSLADSMATLQTNLQCGTTYTWTAAIGGNEDKPINCVSWLEAMAFCIWDGGYLPTEAEWNYAASGGLEQRAYPWSAPATSISINCMTANYRMATNPDVYCAFARPRSVGAYSDGDGKWEHADLAGNVLEWTLDYYGPLPSTCDNCANVASTTQTARIWRSGSYISLAVDVRPGRRGSTNQTDRDQELGFRCARPVPM